MREQCPSRGAVSLQFWVRQHEARRGKIQANNNSYKTSRMKNNATGRFNANSLPVLTVCLVTNSVTRGLVTRIGALRWDKGPGAGLLEHPKEPGAPSEGSSPGAWRHSVSLCLLFREPWLFISSKMRWQIEFIHEHGGSLGFPL